MTNRDDIGRMLHDLGNSLNTITLKLEVARLHVEQEATLEAIEEIDQLLAECRTTAEIIRREEHASYQPKKTADPNEN